MTAGRAFVVLALAIAPQLPAQTTEPCRGAASSTLKGPHLFLEAMKPAAKDTLVMARLCLLPPKAGVGSYTATLSFDSAAMRTVRVEVSGGMQVANMNIAGTIRLAGASPNGFARGQLATIAFKPLRGRGLGRVKVVLAEANSPSGVSLLGVAKVAGHPASDRKLGVAQTTPAKGEGVTRTLPRSVDGSVLRVDSISPRSSKIEAEGVTDLVVYGKGFAAAGNTVFFDAVAIEGLLSEGGGTIIRFAAPTWIPAHGAVEAHRVGAGRVAVKVRTAAGTSNAVTFTVRGDDR